MGGWEQARQAQSIRRKLKNALKVDEYLDGRSIIDKRHRCLIPDEHA